MDFTADSYRSAALEHLDRAQQFHREERYFLAHYFAGVAVECLLRAYLLRDSPEFDARHDLYELARGARFFELVPSALQKEYGAKFSILNLRWRSNHRYATEKQWRDYLSDLKADFNGKGDRVKNNSRTLLNIALEVVNLGDRQWNSWKMELVEQVRALLTEHFPGAEIDLWQDAYSDKVSGHLVWSGFDGEEQLDRQEQVHSWLHRGLGPQAQFVSTILTYSTNEYQVMSLA